MLQRAFDITAKGDIESSLEHLRLQRAFDITLGGGTVWVANALERADRLARELRARIAGIEATLFNEVDQRIDIAVRFPRDERLDLARALSSPVQLPGGQTVPLSSFLVLQEERPVRELLRRNQRRMVTISGEVQGRDLDAVWRDAQQVVDDLALPGNIRVVEEGERLEIQLVAPGEGQARTDAMVMATHAVVVRASPLGAALYFEAPLAY